MRYTIKHDQNKMRKVIYKWKGLDIKISDEDFIKILMLEGLTEKEAVLSVPFVKDKNFKKVIQEELLKASVFTLNKITKGGIRCIPCT